MFTRNPLPFLCATKIQQHQGIQSKKSEWKKKENIHSSKAFGKEFLTGLIKIAKQNSVFGNMVISQLNLSKMQIQWPIVLKEILYEWQPPSCFLLFFTKR